MKSNIIGEGELSSLPVYNSFQFLWPPRPEKAIPPNLFGFYKRKGWVAQYKKNGTCSVIAIAPDGHIRVWTRHGQPHKAWDPVNSVALLPLVELGAHGWIVLFAELLHSKTRDIKDTIYIYDIGVYGNHSLVGMSFMSRMELLYDLFHPVAECEDHYVITNNCWLAKPIIKDFKRHFSQIQEVADMDEGNSENEGLVLKKANSTLRHFGSSKSNSAWQVKCRVATKNYTF